MPLLDLAYNDALPRDLLVSLEREGRRLGLPLAVLERLGQREDLARAFVHAARRGDATRVRFLAAAVAESVELPPPVPLRAPAARAATVAP